ncbi:MAG: hypothetical protein M3680_32400 [Myxococcota bacterium]|nr:hypothetical protein [Myxococcota bacterium]
MRNLLVLSLALTLGGCTVGLDAVGGGEEMTGDEHDTGEDEPAPGTGEGIGGAITADTTWSGTVRIKGVTTIAPGVTVTIAPGTTVNFANSTRIQVDGTLAIDGTAAAKVNLQAEAGATYYSGFLINGTLTMAYTVFKGGAMTINASSNVTISDSKMWGAGGDYVIMNGGTFSMTYSQIGADPGVPDTTHCNLHLNGGTISVTRSNINGAPYGLMLYGGNNAVFTNNNWFDNPKDVETSPGVSGDFSGSYFQKGPPAAVGGATLTYTNLAPAKLTDAGPRG